MIPDMSNNNMPDDGRSGSAGGVAYRWMMPPSLAVLTALMCFNCLWPMGECGIEFKTI